MEVIAGAAILAAGIAGGIAWGKRETIAHQRETIAHLRAQLAFHSGATPVYEPPKEERRSNVPAVRVERGSFAPVPQGART